MGCTMTTTKPSMMEAGHKQLEKFKISRHTFVEDININEVSKNTSQSEELLEQQLDLNRRQKFLILKSWKGISREIKTTAVNMFTRLFETNEELKGYFVDVSKCPSISDIRTSSKFEGHAVMVMHIIDDAMSNLDDVTCVENLLLNVGESHRKFPWFQSCYFWRLEEPFLLAVHETLGDRYTANMEHIYKKAIHFILNFLEAGFKKRNALPESPQSPF
ncbi:neuroglobin-like [Mizuhopecten yessoensis]|uniref:Neuroglobin n=1 Tax=Mizuhopecten yessoensis TaxID=6573 RepID=A0A210PW06_MIZYE|nr:neuroglobin-like [Mizuhopecten yessoensis]OWF40646.1 Neuroglobin [Mizuhopecten yessoensis]